MNKNARQYAYEILKEILINDAYSNITLNKVFSRNEISKQDKAYITELVYGSIKNKIYLEDILKKFSKGRVKVKVKILLVMSIYQIIKLNKTPDFAVVNEAVEISKKEFGIHTSKFINGVLRNIIRNYDSLSTLYSNSDNDFCVKYSCPVELFNILKKQYGNEKSRSIIKSFNSYSKNSIRVNILKNNIDSLQEYFQSIGISSSKSEITKDCLLVDRLNIKDDAFSKGLYIVQDEASALVAHAISEDVNENFNILDVCAAPGGKSLHVASKYQNSKVISCDKYDHKLELIRDNAKKLGINNIEIRNQDATVDNQVYREKFDIVVCDVPCSGIGVIKNKPEIKYKINDAHIEDIAKLQLKILNISKNYVKENGILIYSTCTIDKRENEYNIEKFLKENNNFSLETITIDSSVKEYKKGMLNILPDEYNCDGFFICKLRRKS